jgi:hypothetical protein
MSHQKNRGLSKKRRGEISQRAFKNAQARNMLNREANEAQHAANKRWAAENKTLTVAMHARPEGVKTNRGRGNPNRLSVLKRAVSRIGKVQQES